MSGKKSGKVAPKGNKKSNGQKKANGVDIRRATSSLQTEPVRSVPAAMGSMKSTGRPKTQGMPNGDCRVVHREYLQDVSMAASFTSSSFSINPGVSRTFPWLSQIASRFESYRFNKLKFCFETSCSSTQTGAVLLVPDYDASDSAPTSKVQALAYRNSARAQAWLSFCQVSLSEDLHKMKSQYVRAGTNPAGTDIKLYDVGNLFLCVQGSDTNTVGELWVEYDVVLMTPAISGSSDILSKKIASGGGSVSKTAIFGAVPVLTGVLDVSVSGNTVTFNQIYEGLLALYVGGGTLVTPTLTGTTTRTQLSNSIEAGGANGSHVLAISAQAGQTLIYDFSASASVSSAVLRFGNYQYSLA